MIIGDLQFGLLYYVFCAILQAGYGVDENAGRIAEIILDIFEGSGARLSGKQNFVEEEREFREIVLREIETAYLAQLEIATNVKFPNS